MENIEERISITEYRFLFLIFIISRISSPSIDILTETDLRKVITEVFLKLIENPQVLEEFARIINSVHEVQMKGKIIERSYAMYLAFEQFLSSPQVEQILLRYRQLMNGERQYLLFDFYF